MLQKKRGNETHKDQMSKYQEQSAKYKWFPVCIFFFISSQSSEVIYSLYTALEMILQNC